MPKGTIFHDPSLRSIDEYSSREIVQLPDYLGHEELVEAGRLMINLSRSPNPG